MFHYVTTYHILVQFSADHVSLRCRLSSVISRREHNNYINIYVLLRLSTAGCGACRLSPSRFWDGGGDMTSSSCQAGHIGRHSDMRHLLSHSNNCDCQGNYGRTYRPHVIYIFFIWRIEYDSWQFAVISWLLSVHIFHEFVSYASVQFGFSFVLFFFVYL